MSVKVLFKQIGSILKEKREDNGWSLADASRRSGLSKKMCWTIERGVNTRIENYEIYAGALGVVFDDVLNKVRGIEPIRDELEWIETEIELGTIGDIQEKIKTLQIPKEYVQIAKYLEGKYYFYMGKFRKSERLINQAIDESFKYIETHSHLNILTSSLNVLSNIYYHYYQEPKKAFEICSEAIDHFQENGERQTEYLLAYLNRSIYLEKLDRLCEAEKYSDFLWENRNKIPKADAQAVLCEHVARVKLYHSDYKAAREAIRRGFDIARRNQLHMRASDLSLVLGDWYLEQNESRMAEKSYHQALVFKQTERAHIRLARFYMSQKEWTKTIEHFEKALGLNPTDAERSEALIQLGKIHLINANKKKAIEYLKEAEKIEPTQEVLGLLAVAYSGIDLDQKKHYMEYLTERLKEMV